MTDGEMTNEDVLNFSKFSCVADHVLHMYGTGPARGATLQGGRL